VFRVVVINVVKQVISCNCYSSARIGTSHSLVHQSVQYDPAELFSMTDDQKLSKKIQGSSQPLERPGALTPASCCYCYVGVTVPGRSWRAKTKWQCAWIEENLLHTYKLHRMDLPLQRHYLF